MGIGHRHPGVLRSTVVRRVYADSTVWKSISGQDNAGTLTSPRCRGGIEWHAGGESVWSAVTDRANCSLGRVPTRLSGAGYRACGHVDANSAAARTIRFSWGNAQLRTVAHNSHALGRGLFVAVACTLLTSACGSSGSGGPAPTSATSVAVSSSKAPASSTAASSATQSTPPETPAPTTAELPTTIAPPTIPSPALQPPPSVQPAAPEPQAAPTTTKAPSVYYGSCAEAKRAGFAPLHRGDPGYRPGLDRNGDGIACEK
ncbi:hypothetical protein GL305_18685 [Nocardia seriolae]|nr:hypothetical protein [Nocardia seriolae]MTJ72651.1 hypothetical protein [Nocardia seriolae]MTJ87942.1 hypothetical protein [Nocardia seriolae]MTK31932.1 hypothetical protein [Nocardia seriolae]MTK40844.1 hypothetical protein [Nocardia seriolae]